MVQDNIKKEKIQPISKVIDDSFMVMDKFAELLELETSLLREAKFEDAKELKHLKKEFTVQYQKHVQMLLNRKEEISVMPKELKDKIVKKRSEFSIILDENMKVINSVKQASQRLIDKIIETARDAVIQEKTYGANGVADKSLADGKNAPVSISINETL